MRITLFMLAAFVCWHVAGGIRFRLWGLPVADVKRMIRERAPIPWWRRAVADVLGVAGGACMVGAFWP